VTRADFLKRLCEGYVRCYRTLNITTRANWGDLTCRELDFFGRLGEMLGFRASREMEKMDLCWSDVDSGDLVLYLERETEAHRVPMDTLPKLLQSAQSRRARYLVGVFGWVREEDLPTIKNTIETQAGDRSLLVIAWVGSDKDEAKKLLAFIIADSKTHARVGEGEIDKDSYWYARFTQPWIAEGPA
jgi:hypothetical protein